ncbi:MAG TPA: hypothetical protein VM677_05840 [Actinokineospora sp.]|nr:hypothetical protein [Actinokineospora sp.]
MSAPGEDLRHAPAARAWHFVARNPGESLRPALVARAWYLVARNASALGCVRPTVGPPVSGASSPDDGAIRSLLRAWRLATRHGLALAEVIEAVRVDLDHRVRFARQVDARMAGPRASAVMLAVLPVLALLLGESMGAAPIAVLIGSTAGQTLLVIGVALACAGVTWTARLTGKAKR